MKLKDIFWALKNEPKRIWKWWHRHNPWTEKRYSFLEAVRAVIENPPCFDRSWDLDVESKIERRGNGKRA